MSNLTIIESDEQKREASEMNVVNELFAALDANNLAAADDAIAKLRPTGKLKLADSPRKTEKD